jgi:hypothetical protein
VRVSLTVTLAAALVALLASAPAAHASDITFERITPTCSGGDECRYFTEQPYDNHTLTGSPGEVNRITVGRGGPSGGAIRFRDDGAPIREIGNCTRIDEHEVLCNGRYGYAAGGDMNDVLMVSGDGLSIGGGEGDDELAGGDGPDTLSGGPGRDTLRGGGGFDTFYDGADSAGDADVYEGGEAGGFVSYVSSTVPVTIDLADPGPVQGEAGEGDRMTGITSVQGGGAADTLRAAPSGSALDGASGDDTLIGGPGRDVLEGSVGRNTVDAGGGDDRIAGLAPVGSDRIGCGDGRDVVDIPARGDLVGGDCERIEFDFGPVVRSLLPLRSLSSTVAIVDRFRCDGRGRPSLELRVASTYRTRGLPRAGTLLGRKVASTRTCRARVFHRVGLSRAGARLLRRHGRLPVEVRINDPGARERYVTELVEP